MDYREIIKEIRDDYNYEYGQYKRYDQEWEIGEKVNKRIMELPEDVWIKEHPHYVNLYIHTFKNMESPRRVAFCLKGGAYSTIKMLDGINMDSIKEFDDYYIREICVDKENYGKLAVKLVDEIIKEYDKKMKIDNLLELYYCMEFEGKKYRDYSEYRDDREKIIDDALFCGKHEKESDEIKLIRCMKKERIEDIKNYDYFNGAYKVLKFKEYDEDFRKVVKVGNDFKINYYLFKKLPEKGKYEVFEFKKDFNEVSARNFLRQWDKAEKDKKMERKSGVKI